MASKQWMFTDPLPVIEFWEELRRYHIEEGREDPSSPLILVGFRQNKDHWTAQSLTQGGIYNVMNGSVEQSREWLKKRRGTPIAAAEEGYAVGG